MRKDSLIPSLLGIPPIQISRELLAKGFALDIPWSWRLREGGE